MRSNKANTRPVEVWDCEEQGAATKVLQEKVDLERYSFPGLS